MEIYEPDGAIGRPTLQLAPSPPLLSGLRIGVLDNDKPNADVLLDRLAAALAERGGATVAVVTDKGPGHNAATPCSDAVLDRLTQEADLVLTGSAD